MALQIQRIDTWASPLEDKPGSLAGKLAALSQAGVNLEVIVARRAPDKPGTGVVFVTPIEGAARVRAAREAGFQKTDSLHTIQIHGPNKRGVAAAIAQALADAALNLRGMSGAAIGSKFVAYVALDTAAEASKAVRLLRGL